MGGSKRMINRTWGMIGSMRGNARAMLLFEPMWIIPYTMYNIYASLYMRDLGLNPEEIGLLASIGLASYILCSAFAGHLTDRLGRRRATLIFDLLGWSIPVAIWALAHNFWYFLIAVLINGLQAIPATSWTCLLVEDREPEETRSIFIILQMIGPLGGFVAPLAGLIVRSLGVVPGTRLLYLFALIGMTAMFLGRNHYTRETAVGKARREATAGHTIRDVLKDYRHSIRLLTANHTAVAFFLLTGILFFRESLSAPFYQLFQVDRIGLAKNTLAIFPALGGAAAIFTLLVILPWQSGRSERSGLILGITLTAGSLAALIWSPYKSIVTVAFSTLCSAMGGAILIPALNTGWYSSLGDEERAKVVALAMLVWGLIRMPAGYLGGILYQWGPRGPFLAGLVILLLSMAFVIAWPAANRQNA